ncbi:MAG TPA: hypothetical protein VIL46_08395 [Gemmataceae bacterium]
MRSANRTTLGIGLALLLACPAAAQDDAKAVIRKAVEATGGAELLNKYKAGKIDASGTISVMGADIEFTSNSWYQVPSKLKNRINFSIMDQKIEIVQIVNGDRVKMTVNGMDQELPDEQLAELRNSTRLQTIYQLTPLLEGKYELKTLEPKKVNGSEAAGVSVSAEGWDDPVKLYFDKKTGLLVRIERKGLDPNGQPGTQALTYSDFKKFDGILRPTTSVAEHEGTKYLTIKIGNYEHHESLPAKEFAIGED